MNRLRYSVGNLQNLRNNHQHTFAMNHSIMIYRSNALYSFIPKNACSTLRLSIAIENGCIDNIEDGHWIHSNNNTFNATLGEALSAKYTFIILRCPFRRLASAFLDKFVAKEPEAWEYRSLMKRRVELDDLTFRNFIHSIRNQNVLNSNIHWRPQSAFFIYKEYSDYFCLENFSEAVSTLKSKINMNIVDARELTNHGTNFFKPLSDKCYSDTNAFDIALMKRMEGHCPTHAALYDEELIEIVRALYKADFDIYKSKFGENGLLF